MHMLSDDYLKRLRSLLGPCRVDAIEFLEVGYWLITARDDAALPACCNVCDRSGTRYDHVWRKVRHLNFRSKRVFVFLQLPRVQCAEHGVRIVGQSIFDHHSKYSPTFQEFVLREFLSDPSAGSSVARRLVMPTTTMMRIVHSGISRKCAAHRDPADKSRFSFP
jgi:transposase